MILQATFGASKMRSRPFARAEPIKLLYSTLPKRQFNALQDYVVDFAPFPEGGFPKALVNSQGQVNGCMDDSGPWLAAAGLWRLAGGGLWESAGLGHGGHPGAS